MRATSLESDVFKFHLKALVEAKMVRKDHDGTYSLTAAGKEFANNLDDQSGQRNKSPKVSVIIVARRSIDNTTQYLFHQRKRHPFYDYWGLISGPVPWGESIEKAAEAELEKQTGFTAKCTVRGFCRVRDYVSDERTLLEDKLFAVVTTNAPQGVPREWSGGTTRWMALQEYTLQPKRFNLTEKILDHLERGIPYFEADTLYVPSDY